MTSTCLGVAREHEPSVDPRRAGQCVRCGRTYTPPSDPVLKRDIEQERAITRDASRFAPYVQDPEAVADSLRAFAERRAHPGPVLMGDGRDLALEGLEELADLSSYALWAYAELEAEGRTDEDADHERMLLRRTLAAAVEGFDALLTFRQVRR